MTRQTWYALVALATLALVAALAVALWWATRVHAPAAPATAARSASPRDAVVVVGGGLAGLAAALTAADGGRHVTLLEGTARLGGNSFKASSGVNALDDALQADTLASCGPDANAAMRARVGCLVAGADAALAWLRRQGLALDAVVRLGGHSRARTRRPPGGGPVGATMMAALASRVYGHPRITVRTEARVTGWDRAAGTVTLADGTRLRWTDLVWATGGFAADRDMVARYRPDLAHLPTTNHAAGTGGPLRLLQQAGARLVDMDRIQVHPTGLWDPADPHGTTRVLAAEMLRGVGGTLHDAYGDRFCDELATRVAVVAAMQAAEGPFRLQLTAAQVAAAQAHVDHYVSRGLMYRDADGGAWATVEPVLHYCMGGVAVDPGTSRVLDLDGRAWEHVYAVGEATGGLHGHNRLGGNALLECVVFGQAVGTALTADRAAAADGAAAADAADAADAVWVTVRGRKWVLPPGFQATHPRGDELFQTGADLTDVFMQAHGNLAMLGPN